MLETRTWVSVMCSTLCSAWTLACAVAKLGGASASNAMFATREVALDVKPNVRIQLSSSGGARKAEVAVTPAVTSCCMEGNTVFRSGNWQI